MNLKNKSLLVIDTGPHSFLSPFMAQFYGTVYYTTMQSAPYRHSPLAQIGKGLPGVEWIDNPWRVLRKVDLVWFPDVHDSDFQKDCLAREIPVCGSLGGSKMEQDKYHFLTYCVEHGLPMPHTYRAEGLDDVWEYVKDKKGPLYLKSAEKYRGDWETFKHTNRYATELYLNRKRTQLGAERAKEIEILIQNHVESEVEVGIDGFRLKGDLPAWTAIGYEIKDEGIIERAFKEPPPLLEKVLDTLSPEYNRLGYQGPYSSEMRITKNGTVIPIDETCRCGEPPTPALLRMYGESYAQAVYSLAHGELPVIKPVAECGAQIIMASSWYQENELHVGFPKDVGEYVFLKNGSKRNGQFYCTPNGEEAIFGSIACEGKTWQEATKKVMEIAEEMDVMRLDYRKDIFDEAEEVIQKGLKYGIKF